MPNPHRRGKLIRPRHAPYGTPTPPTDNRAPDGPEFGQDPHGFGRGNAALLDEITTLLTTGVIPNECGALACQSTTP